LAQAKGFAVAFAAAASEAVPATVGVSVASNMADSSTGSVRLHDICSTVATFEEVGVGDDETKLIGAGLETHTGSRNRSSMRQIMRMLAVVAACAVAVQGVRAGLYHVRGAVRPTRSVHQEVVEASLIPNLHFNLSEASSHLKGLTNVTNQLNLTKALNFTSSQLLRVEDLIDGKRLNFTKPFNFTPPQVQKVKDLIIFVPSFVDLQHEYYDSDKLVMGSWHWLSCKKDHMKMCNVSAVRGCCCEPGFAYVAQNIGSPMASNAAAGAAGGAFTGASKVAGAAGGAVKGAVLYLWEGGKCTLKQHLSKSVRSHLS